jgi:hypothetical protein
MKTFGIWIRDEKFRDPDPGNNIPDPQHSSDYAVFIPISPTKS